MQAIVARHEDYRDFLESKRIVDMPTGFDVPLASLPSSLFDFQQAIVQWSLRRGRAAIFADTGLGKTRMQIVWADRVVKHTLGNVLILAPLAVAQQTYAESQSIGIPITICRTSKDIQSGINITNYEMLSHFDAADFTGIVIDESSILKSIDGSTRKAITLFAASIPYRLACTATPAPNDLLELSNHAEFLGVMGAKEIIALFFTQDGNSSHNMRLKRHGEKDFFRWLASWSVAIRNPADLGFAGSDFVLPPLHIVPRLVDSVATIGRLFAIESLSLSEQLTSRRETITDRVAACADAVNASIDATVIWCNLNDESRALVQAIPGSVEVTGSDSPEKKAQAMMDFVSGKIRVLISKPEICGFGMNWQHCHEVWFVGVSHSFEQYYQAIRRFWRFGQLHTVNVHIVTSAQDGAVVTNLKRKEQEYSKLMDNLVSEIKATGLSLGATTRDTMNYEEDVQTGKDWTLYLGDSVLRMDAIASESVGLSIFSPPFPGMYAYTNSTHDMGNTQNYREMLDQFRFLAGPQKLLRVLMPGRICAIHLTQSPVFKGRDGYVGLRDFRGDTIRLMEDEGWLYFGEVTIDKDPQLKASRTKEQSLLFKTLSNDSTLCRMAMADYLLIFKKPGDNPQPVRAGINKKYNGDAGWITDQEWIEWAAPVWYRKTKEYPGGISETDVLNVSRARDAQDERHLCPLQLGVIERAIKLWSSPGDTVLDPFNGIGSSGYQALRFSRKYIGIELKRSYFDTAIKNLQRAEQEKQIPTLFDSIATEENN